MPRLRESFVQAMARQVEDQSHEESEPSSTSKLSVVRWRKAEPFARQNHQFGRVCQNHFVRTDLRDFSLEL